MTPQMASGVNDKLWDSGKRALMDAMEAEKPMVRGPYKRKAE
jgi:hypothetical protein